VSAEALRDALQPVWKSEDARGPLAGVRVVDFGQYLAGPLAACLLADQGAEVIRVEPPGGPRWDGLANALLLRRRRTVTLDLKTRVNLRRAQALAASADVVIENFRPGVADRLGIGPGRLAALAPSLVYCSLPGFGSDDPRAGEAAWEGVVMAAAGAYSLDVAGSLIPQGGAPPSVPVFSPLPLASVFGALEGAMAVVAALIAGRRDGVGQHIEVPLFDALFEAIGLRGISFGRGGPTFTDFGSGFYRCQDGRYLTFVATWFRHLEWFVEAAGVRDWVDDGIVDFDRLWSDPATLTELVRRLTDLFATRPAEEWESVGRAHGCTIGMLRSLGEWMDTPQATESGTLVDVVDPVSGDVRLPGPAVLVHGSTYDEVPARGRPGEQDSSVIEAVDRTLPLLDEPVVVEDPKRSAPFDPPPLAGVRVVDLSRVVAAPTAAKLLAQLGADVVKIDEDPINVRAAFPMPTFHEHLNRGKHSMALDLKGEADARIFAALAQDADVIVQNFTLGTAERLGVDRATVRRYAPNAIHLYLNTYGRRGPWAGHRGYAELANITTGVTERSLGGEFPASGSSASMDYPRWTFTDYSGGVLGAFGALLALYDRDRAGSGCLVETSLVRATALEQIPYTVRQLDSEGRPSEPGPGEPRGTRAGGWGPLQRLYDTADGTVFIGAAPTQLRDVVGALDLPDPAGADDSELTSVLSTALLGRTVDEVCLAFRKLDIGVHRVLSVSELMRAGGIAEQRGLRLEDASEHFGTVVMPGPVVRFGRTPMRPGHLPGPFGSDRDEILANMEGRGT
jgi:crotonobetainyl-CoA:carnitine CoA-transferase CaiB-like acyl-CoA transferase